MGLRRSSSVVVLSGVLAVTTAGVAVADEPEPGGRPAPAPPVVWEPPTEINRTPVGGMPVDPPADGMPDVPLVEGPPPVVAPQPGDPLYYAPAPAPSPPPAPVADAPDADAPLAAPAVPVAPAPAEATAQDRDPTRVSDTGRAVGAKQMRGVARTVQTA